MTLTLGLPRLCCRSWESKAETATTRPQDEVPLFCGPAPLIQASDPQDVAGAQGHPVPGPHSIEY